MIWHILPINDIKDHVEDSTCPCEPVVLVEGGDLIIVHNSWDGREAVEEATEIINSPIGTK
jgi:hypothetical protein